MLIFLVGLNAQKRYGEFSLLRVKALYNVNENRNEFHEYWKVNESFGVALEFPFYLGILETGLSYSTFLPLSINQPEFSSINYYLLWGERFEVTNWMHIKIDGGPGLFEMDFEDEDLNTDRNLLKERELSLTANISLSLVFSDYISLETGYTFLRILTAKPIELGYISTGIVVTLKSPEWLRDILK